MKKCSFCLIFVVFTEFSVDFLEGFAKSSAEFFEELRGSFTRYKVFADTCHRIFELWFNE